MNRYLQLATIVGAMPFLLCSCAEKPKQMSVSQKPAPLLPPGNTLPEYDLAFIDDGSIFLMASDGSIKEIPFKGETPCLAPDGKNVLYYDDESSGYLYDADRNTATLVPLIKIQHPAWSPNSQQIAYATDDQPSSIRLYNRANNSILSIDQGNKPIWSPDGSTLFYEKNGGIWRYSVTAKQTRLFVSKGEDPQISPDGKRIAFIRHAGLIAESKEPMWVDSDQIGKDIGSSSVWLISSNATDEKRCMITTIHAAKKDKFFESVQWSPNGKHLLVKRVGEEFTRIRPTLFFDLSVFNIEKSAERYLCQNVKGVFGQSWLPDGHRVVYTTFDLPPPVPVTKNGQQYEMDLTPRGMRSDILARAGLDLKYLNNAKIFIIDTRTDIKTFLHNGHSIHVRHTAGY